MSLLQWILRFLRNSYPVRWSIRSILALLAFLRRRTKRSPGESSSTPENHLENSATSTASMHIHSTDIYASHLPDTNSLHPYPFNHPNASYSSHDISTSSDHGDSNVQRSSRQLRRILRSNVSEDFTARGRPNPRIDLPSVSGAQNRVSRSASRRSVSRPNSFVGYPTSRPISVYTTGSHISIPSITIDHGQGGISKPMQTSPVQVEAPYALPGPSHQDLSELVKTHERFRPIAPLEHARYEQEAFAPHDDLEYSIQPQTVMFQTEDIPVGWKKLLHPEGARYYVYQDKRFYTDANLMDNVVKERIMSCIDDFQDFCRGRSINLPRNSNTVFHLRNKEDDPNKYTCEYYIADHDTRSVFWLDLFDASWVPTWSMVKGVTTASHVEHVVTSQYWYHCHLFPNSFQLNVSAVDELRDILAHSICDALTSSTSTVPYSISDLNEMMRLCNNLRKNTSTGGGVSAYSRIMYIFVEQRFLNHHDQLAVRLDRDRSVYFPESDSRHRPWLLRCVSPALFSAPYLYFRLLRKLWVDHLVHEASWADFVSKMNEEWQQIILFNTVLLNANVAFLAIGSVDISGDSPGRSPAQIASFLSIIASFGSIIVGLVLARKHRAKAKETALQVATFLNAWDKNRVGLATLAIIYSTPYAMLMWGVVCFLLAFSFMCYTNSDIFVRALMSGAWFIVAVLVLWCITALALWDRTLDQEKSFWEIVHRLLSLLLFGPWWLVESVFNTISKSRKLIPSRSTQAHPSDQPAMELRQTRKSSVGTVVVELWKKSSLFSRAEPDKENTDDAEATAVGV